MADLKTPREMAEQYQTAIDNLITGKLASYSIPGRGTFTKHSLAQLESAYKYWRNLAEQESAGTVGVVALADLNQANRGRDSTSA